MSDPAWRAHLPPVPELHVAGTRQAWEQQRERVRAQLRELLGPMPPGPDPFEVRTLAHEETQEWVLERFEFANGAGANVPGWLLLPRHRQGRVPAVLYCHWHGGEYRKGKVELFESEHTPVAPGPALVREGYAVLAIDAYCFGERNGRGPGDSQEEGAAGEQAASKFNLWFGRTLWGMMIRDDLLALDYLESRPEVDAQRIGVTGMSMGATRAWWLMALDERLRAGVAVACLTRYQNLIAHAALNYHGLYYYVPGFLRHFDTEAVVALIAPRPILMQNGDCDAGSPADGIREIETRVRPAYALYERAANYRSDLHAGMGHEYRLAMWQETLAWFARHLKDESGSAGN